MNQDASTDRVEWPYGSILLALLVGVFVQSIFLPCLCYRGTVNMYFGGAVDLLVLLRLFVAKLCRERDKEWVFYAILPSLIVPVLLLVEHIWVPH